MYKKLNAWSKVAEKFDMTLQEAEKEVQGRTNSMWPVFEESEKYPIWFGKRRRSHT